jgi:hypothetical protein
MNLTPQKLSVERVDAMGERLRLAAERLVNGEGDAWVADYQRDVMDLLGHVEVLASGLEAVLSGTAALSKAHQALQGRACHCDYCEFFRAAFYP